MTNPTVAASALMKGLVAVTVVPDKVTRKSLLRGPVVVRGDVLPKKCTAVLALVTAEIEAVPLVEEPAIDIVPY